MIVKNAPQTVQFDTQVHTLEVLPEVHTGSLNIGSSNTGS